MALEQQNGDQPLLSFEESLHALEAAVHDLEEGQLGLTESLARYEESIAHLKRCYQLLEAAEKKIELLTGVAEDGTPSTEPFAGAGQTDAKAVGRKSRGRTAAHREAAQPQAHDIDASGDST